MNFININKILAELKEENNKYIDFKKYNNLNNDEKSKLISMIASDKKMIKKWNIIKTNMFLDNLIEWINIEKLGQNYLDIILDSFFKIIKSVEDKNLFFMLFSKILDSELFIYNSKKINGFFGNNREKFCEDRKNLILKKISHMENKKEKLKFHHNKCIDFSLEDLKKVKNVNDKVKYLNSFISHDTTANSSFKEHIEKIIKKDGLPPLSNYIDLSINNFSNMKIKTDLLPERELLINNLMNIYVINTEMLKYQDLLFKMDFKYSKKFQYKGKHLDDIFLRQVSLYLNNKTNDLFHIFPLVEKIFSEIFGNDYLQGIKDSDNLSVFGKKCLFAILESKQTNENENRFLGMGLKDFYCHGSFVDIKYESGYFSFKKQYSMIIIPIILEIYDIH